MHLKFISVSLHNARPRRAASPTLFDINTACNIQTAVMFFKDKAANVQQRSGRQRCAGGGVRAGTCKTRHKQLVLLPFMQSHGAFGHSKARESVDLLENTVSKANLDL